MNRRQRLRRVGILCCHFLRNLAFYKAGWRNGDHVFKGQFLATANANCLDVCVLEWCKLFAEKSGKQHWSKVITERDRFFDGLLQAVSRTDTEFDAYVKEMRGYRDKFIAHLDDELEMRIPKLRVARKSISYLYTYLLENEEEGTCFHDAPKKASSVYENFVAQGKRAYRN